MAERSCSGRPVDGLDVGVGIRGSIRLRGLNDAAFGGVARVHIEGDFQGIEQLVNGGDLLQLQVGIEAAIGDPKKILLENAVKKNVQAVVKQLRENQLIGKLIAEEHADDRRDREAVQDPGLLAVRETEARQVAEDQRQPRPPDEELKDHHHEEFFAGRGSRGIAHGSC